MHTFGVRVNNAKVIGESLPKARTAEPSAEEDLLLAVDPVKAATDGRGTDVILDMVGGDYVAGELQALAHDGQGPRSHGGRTPTSGRSCSRCRERRPGPYCSPVGKSSEAKLDGGRRRNRPGSALADTCSAKWRLRLSSSR